MITLKQLIKLIPYTQDYSVWYVEDAKKEYYCIYYVYGNKSYIDFIRKYGACPVKHILADNLAGKDELCIYLKEGSANNEV